MAFDHNNEQNIYFLNCWQETGYSYPLTILLDTSHTTLYALLEEPHKWINCARSDITPFRHLS